MHDIGPTNATLVVARMAPWPFRSHPYLFWAFTLVLATVLCIVASRQSPDPRRYLGLVLATGIGLLSVPLVFRFAYARFSAWGETVDAFLERESDGLAPSAWVAEELALFRGSGPMYSTGLFTALVAVLTYWLSDYPVGVRHFAEAVAGVVITASAFLAGLGLYGIFCVGRMIWRLGKFRVRVKNHKFGVLSTGRVLTQCYFAVALAWTPYVVGAVLGLPHIDSDRLVANLPILVLAVPTLLAMFAQFLICQIPLHERMVDYKRTELFTIDQALDTLRSVAAEDLNLEIRQKIEFFENRRAHTMLLPEWPFGFGALLGALASTVMVIVPSLISQVVAAAARAAIR